MKKKATRIKKLHHAEEKFHHMAEKAMHADEKVHRKIEKAEHAKKKRKKDPKPDKMKVVMREFKEGKLHSGSKKGPMVTNPKQAVAIAYSEQRKADKKRRK